MEFDENAERFRIFGGIHIKYVASFCAVFGVCATVGVFVFGWWIFPWYLYEESVNTTARIAFVCFLIGGCASHGLILYSLYSTRTQWLMPAFAYHLFIAVLNAITSLIAVGELLSEGNITLRDAVMAKISLVVCPTIFIVQMIGFYVIIKCRNYIQCKRRHVRNGEPPRVREVIMLSNTNKVSIMELSFDQFNETMYSPA
ncbi:unnamed protein product [Caenorhabditis sp. 36 PRJEB53466]|nr:unnamed protein product [Caenorhabditis sp. 36 PRJEB53466]